jgi:hypothetical protein
MIRDAVSLRPIAAAFARASCTSGLAQFPHTTFGTGNFAYVTKDGNNTAAITPMFTTKTTEASNSGIAGPFSHVLSNDLVQRPATLPMPRPDAAHDGPRSDATRC